MIEFTVLGGPVAQPRQRQRIVMTQRGAFAHNYTPTDSPVNSWKADVKSEAKKVMPKTPLEGPLRIELRFYLPRPKNLCRKKDPDGSMWHCGSKDIDNLYKSLVDALTGVIYRDDKQICWAEIVKVYHEKDSRPRAHIRINELGDSSPVLW